MPEVPVVTVVSDGEVLAEITATDIDAARVDRVADFHCVTTWSVSQLWWSGMAFAPLWERVVVAAPAAGHARFFTVHGLDRYHAVFTVEDAVHPDVLIADRLNGEPLDARHGAPFRFVTPAQYAYKSVKHLTRIELHDDQPRSGHGVIEHLRARVALEERHRYLPSRLVRLPYRLLVRPTAWIAERRLTDSRRSRRRGRARRSPP